MAILTSVTLAAASFTALLPAEDVLLSLDLTGPVLAATKALNMLSVHVTVVLEWPDSICNEHCDLYSGLRLSGKGCAEMSAHETSSSEQKQID